MCWAKLLSLSLSLCSKLLLSKSILKITPVLSLDMRTVYLTKAIQFKNIVAHLTWTLIAHPQGSVPTAVALHGPFYSPHIQTQNINLFKHVFVNDYTLKGQQIGLRLKKKVCHLTCQSASRLKYFMTQWAAVRRTSKHLTVPLASVSLVHDHAGVQRLSETVGFALRHRLSF